MPQILATVILVVVGQLLAKMGMNSISFNGQIESLTCFYLRALFSPLIVSGVIIYGFAVFSWLYVLSKVDLSFAYPFLSLTYVLVILSSWLLLGETIPTLRWAGVFFICVGILLISRS
jgi:drug/metabolite transporter (DMT)-like permease